MDLGNLRSYCVLIERVHAQGHENVLGLHRTTLEITRESFLTRKGDCIIGISSDKACSDLNFLLKSLIQNGFLIYVTLDAFPKEKDEVVLPNSFLSDWFYGYGDFSLSLKSSISLVFRKSDFISDRTVLIKCNKAAREINRSLIDSLKVPSSSLRVSFYSVLSDLHHFLLAQEKELSRSSFIFSPYYLRVSKHDGSLVIPYLKHNNLLERSWQILRKDSFLYIPIVWKEFNKDRISEVVSYFYSHSLSFEWIWGPMIGLPLLKRENRRPPTLKEALKSIIPSSYHEILPRSFDVIGHVAIIEILREHSVALAPYIKEIGSTILRLHSNIRSVYLKGSKIKGDFRVRDLILIAGEDVPLTLYRENNCAFYVDVKHTFFSPRLSYERLRVSRFSSEFNNNGWVWDMFCGVCPFSIQIAKRDASARFYCTDINPSAIELASKNIKLNDLSKRFLLQCIDLREFRQGDISHLIPDSSLLSNVSRIIMNLPEKSLDFLDIIVPFIHKDGCLIHLYQFSESSSPLISAKERLYSHISHLPLKIEKILSIRVVKPFSAALDMTVIDMILTRKE